MLECVINISEGRDLERVRRIGAAAGAALLDVHSDPHHHRSVLTLVGEEAARAVAAAAVAELDLRTHTGVHPRLGVVDVVPFVALTGSTPEDAVRARDDFAAWFASEHGVPCFLYGVDRTLPTIRRDAFATLAPDTGPDAPHPTAGACAVGQRGLMVAFNVWVSDTDLVTTRRLAATVRTDDIRSLGLQVGARLQVSMNLIRPLQAGPGLAYDSVSTAAVAAGVVVDGAELVGLVPSAVRELEPAHRWGELDLAAERTIEARLEACGLR